MKSHLVEKLLNSIHEARTRVYKKYMFLFLIFIFILTTCFGEMTVIRSPVRNLE